MASAINVSLVTTKHLKQTAVLLATLLVTAPALAERVTVFAAASLTDALKEIGATYEKESGDRIVFNFAASSTLERQIEAGAPADIFFSADEAKMDLLEKRNLVVENTRRSRLGNTLVLVVATEDGAAITNVEDLLNPNIKRLALGDPRAVPAGIYAREYLEKQKLWAAVAPKVVPCENVRAALAVVETGNADAAIVYKTDAAISQRVKVAVEIPAADGPRISYPVALMKDSKHAKAARKFLDYLESDAAGKVFQKFGFWLRQRAPAP